MVTKGPPPLRNVVAACCGCNHWQADVPPRVIRDLGGDKAALVLLGEAHAAHLAECPGEGGRIKVLGQWTERPQMSNGKTADGVVALYPLPRWWVWR